MTRRPAERSRVSRRARFPALRQRRARPPAAPLTPAETQIASLSISLQSPTGYTYFRSWYYTVVGSGKLTVNGFSGITEATTKQVTFTATVGVTAEVISIRANEFEVPR